MMILAQIGGDISFSSSSINGDLSIPSSTLMGDITITGVTCEIYRGPYEITPSNEVQTIPIEGKVAKQNIVVNPIPSNYGLITWDGTTLTVS